MPTDRSPAGKGGEGGEGGEEGRMEGGRDGKGGGGERWRGRDSKVGTGGGEGGEGRGERGGGRREGGGGGREGRSSCKLYFRKRMSMCHSLISPIFRYLMSADCPLVKQYWNQLQQWAEGEGKEHVGGV